jgi:peptidoglycan/LPS O-acetylase OafA/YrhL
LRVLPGLAIALAFCIALGAATTSLPLRDFFTRPQTFDFYWRNLVFETEFYLPGVFDTNVEPRAVNGSLWTLHYEVRAYAFLLALGLVGAFSRKWIAVVAWLAVLGFVTAWPLIRGGAQSYDWPVINLFACFIAAALLALYRVSPRPLGWVALLSVVALALTLKTAFADVAMDALLVSATLWFGQQRYPGVADAARFGDFSYGMFIYAFPVQQLVGWLTGTPSPYLMLALAFPVTLVLAAMSWHWVERPCLDLKRFFATRRAATVTPKPA